MIKGIGHLEESAYFNSSNQQPGSINPRNYPRFYYTLGKRPYQSTSEIVRILEFRRPRDGCWTRFANGYHRRVQQFINWDPPLQKGHVRGRSSAIAILWRHSSWRQCGAGIGDSGGFGNPLPTFAGLHRDCTHLDGTTFLKVNTTYT